MVLIFKSGIEILAPAMGLPVDLLETLPVNVPLFIFLLANTDTGIEINAASVASLNNEFEFIYAE